MRLTLRRKKEDDDERREYLDHKKEFFKEKKTRKKRGEITPWTRRERYLVLGVLLSTVVASAILGMSAREWKLPNLPRLTLPKILGEETIVIEGNPKDVKEAEIVKKFESLTDPLSGVYGFFVLRLDDGSFFGVNEKEIFEAASLNKLPVMLAMYKAAEEGSINLSQKYTVKDEDRLSGNGRVTNAKAGIVFTYEELVVAMGKESDNTAFNAVKKILGEERILATMREFNIPEFLLTKNQVAPYDIGFIFKRIFEANDISRETREALIDSMTETIYDDLIAKEMPVPVAHKYGALAHVRNDSGIVFAEKPYVLVVMSKGIIEKEADEVIPEFSRQAYEIESE
ncbi:serine hydrolase [Candidatus Woesebacteria bacterium]|nr:serine hydrolase [Candidatus Woesebacteria bacterium]